jgi:mutator protein MutT
MTGESDPVKAPELCVGAIVVDADALLMVRRGHGPAAGTWSVPGGRVEAGEAMAESVVREVREETGLDVVCGELAGWVELLTDDRHLVVFDFHALVMGGEMVAGDDAAEVAWVPTVEVGERALSPGLAELLHDQGILETFT